MPDPANPTTAERVAGAIITVFFCILGWFIVLNGSISLRAKSGAVSVIDGNAALVVAGATFLFSLLGATLLLRRLAARGSVYFIAALAIAGLPLAFVLTRHLYGA